MNSNPRSVLTLASVVFALIASVAAAESVPVKTSGQAGKVAATGYAREMPPGVTMGVAYLSLRNPAQRPRALRAVELPQHPDASATLHTTVSENGVSRMRPLQEVTVVAGGDLEMQPGATHLMIHGIRLRAGETLQMRLVFADGETLQIAIPVRSMVTAQKQDHGAHHHHHDG